MPRKQVDLLSELARSEADELPDALGDEAHIDSYQVWSTSRENYLAERTDIKSRGEHLLTVKNREPSHAMLRELGEPFMLIYHLVDNRTISADTKLVEAKAKVVTVEPEEELGAPVVQQQLSPEIPSLLTRILEQNQQVLASLTQKRVEPEQSAGGQLGTMEWLAFYEQQQEKVERKVEVERRRNEEFYEKALARVAQQSPAPRDDRPNETASKEDPERTALTLLLTNERVRDRAIDGLTRLIGEEPEPRSWIRDTGDLLAEHGEKLLPVAANALGGLLQYLKPAQPPVAQTAQQQPQPAQNLPDYIYTSPQPPATPAESEDASSAEETFDQAIAHWCVGAEKDLRENAPVLDAVDELLEVMEDFAESAPEQVDGIKRLLQHPPEFIVPILGSAYPQLGPALQLPNAQEWIQKLKVEIAARQPVNIAERAKTA